MDVPGACPAEYQLVEGPPTLEDYLNLRMRAGLSPRRPDQALAALDGGWAALHVVHRPTATTVGMGRRLGDSGWYFHVLDMAVLPDHQRRGLGDTILGALLTKIHDHAPAGAYVSLMADPPGRRLYERHGFAAQGYPSEPTRLAWCRSITHAVVHYPRSLGEFQSWFATDAECLDYLEWLRWPDGFVCPRCGNVGGWRVADGSFKCAGCKSQTAVTGGTLFDRRRTPLTVRCRAASQSSSET